MALTITCPSGVSSNFSGVYSAAVIKIANITGDSAYPLGGYTVSKTQLGLGASQVITDITNIPYGTAPNTYQLIYDDFYQTLRFYLTPASAGTAMNEVTTGTNLSAITIVCQVIGG